MNKISAGNFEIDISEPYPVQVNIIHAPGPMADCQVIRISHHELSDLKYAIDKAMRDMDNKLKDLSCENEVYVR